VRSATRRNQRRQMVPIAGATKIGIRIFAIDTLERLKT